jgi:hypothetical protein
MARHLNQATVVLNLFAVAAVILLYVVEKMNLDDVTPEIHSTPPASKSQSANPEQLALVRMVGIKMVDSPLPAPPPRLVTVASESDGFVPPPATSSLAMDDSLSVPTLKARLVSASPALQTPNPELHPLASNRQMRQPNTALASSLARFETEMSSKKTTPKLAKAALPRHLPIVKSNGLTPLKASIKTSAQSSPAPPIKPSFMSTMKPLQKGPKQTRNSLLKQLKVKGEISRMAAQGKAAATPEIHIQQASLLHGENTLDKVASKGGLDMEIFWPPMPEHSTYLYRVMTQCFGMQSAVVNSNGDLFLASGQMSANNTSLSPLLRQLKQPANTAEHRVIRQIVAQNDLAAGYQPVRVFARSVDARLVDGIAQLTGSPISQQSVVRADYVIDQGRVYIANITYNGVPSNGRVLLASDGC